MEKFKTEEQKDISQQVIDFVNDFQYNGEPVFTCLKYTEKDKPEGEQIFGDLKLEKGKKYIYKI